VNSGFGFYMKSGEFGSLRRGSHTWVFSWGLGTPPSVPLPQDNTLCYGDIRYNEMCQRKLVGSVYLVSFEHESRMLTECYNFGVDPCHNFQLDFYRRLWKGLGFFFPHPLYPFPTYILPLSFSIFPLTIFSVTLLFSSSFQLFFLLKFFLCFFFVCFCVFFFFASLCVWRRRNFIIIRACQVA
jgi:hypothetical protein